MSTAPKSVAKKAQQIQFKATPAAQASPASPAVAGATTAAAGDLPGGAAVKPSPSAGGMTGIQYLATTFQQTHRVAELEGEVQRLLKERGAQLLDANLIARSRWANRHPDSFKSPQFESLKREIENAGGNVQPIMLRPFPAGTQGPNGELYEVVFGHRRHEACRQLGLPVSAVVKEMGESDLFVTMERENREREALSPWEQGTMYRHALDEGLFPSKRKLAESIGMDPSQLGKALAIAGLPDAVVQAFASPTHIQYRHGQALLAAVEKNSAAVIEKAAGLAGAELPPAEVVKQLVAAAEVDTAKTTRLQTRQIDLGPGRSLSIQLDKSGRLRLEGSAGLVSPDRLPELEDALRAFFK